MTLSVVTAKVLDVPGGSFMSHIESGPAYTDSPIHEGYTVPNVDSQVLTPNIPCLTGYTIRDSLTTLNKVRFFYTATHPEFSLCSFRRIHQDRYPRQLIQNSALCSFRRIHQDRYPTNIKIWFQRVHGRPVRRPQSDGSLLGGRRGIR